MFDNIRRILKIRGMILAIEVLLIVAVFIAARAYSQRNLLAGQAPLVTAQLLDGHTFNLQQGIKQQPVLLHFWASWCPVCKLEETSIESLSKHYKVITVAMNSGNNAEVRNYLETQNLSFPVIVDEDGELASRFGVRGVPTSFIIAPDGKIVFSEIGYTTKLGLMLRMWLTGK